jgi:hypothetical protein
MISRKAAIINTIVTILLLISLNILQIFPGSIPGLISCVVVIYGLFICLKVNENKIIKIVFIILLVCYVFLFFQHSLIRVLLNNAK